MILYMSVTMVQSFYDNHIGHLSYTEVHLIYTTFHVVGLVPTSADWLPLQEEFSNFKIIGRGLYITNFACYPEGHQPWGQTYKTANILTRSC